jgi:hypothetical protein
MDFFFIKVHKTLKFAILGKGRRNPDTAISVKTGTLMFLIGFGGYGRRTSRDPVPMGRTENFPDIQKS